VQNYYGQLRLFFPLRNKEMVIACVAGLAAFFQTGVGFLRICRKEWQFAWHISSGRLTAGNIRGPAMSRLQRKPADSGLMEKMINAYNRRNYSRVKIFKGLRFSGFRPMSSVVSSINFHTPNPE